MSTNDAPESAVSTCRKDCEHFDLTMTNEEFVGLSEGRCEACGIPADGRTADGFASCSCCGIEWKIEGQKITLRAPVKIKESVDA